MLLFSVFLFVIPLVVGQTTIRVNSTTTAAPRSRILLFWKTIPYFHMSIPAAIAAIQQLGRQNGFDVDSSNNSNVFTDSNLQRYAAVVFVSTTGDVLNVQEQNAFTRFIQSGKGYVGIHAAADTEYGWSWYNQLIGGYFMNHPNLQNATLEVVDQTFIATRHLPKYWRRFDEWYSFQSTYWRDVKVLITIDEKSYTGGEHGRYHPMSWYQYFDGGRSFYTQLSHQIESFSDPTFTQHILGGILFAIYGRTT